MPHRLAMAAALAVLLPFFATPEDPPTSAAKFNVRCPAPRACEKLEKDRLACEAGKPCDPFIAGLKQLLSKYDCKRPEDTRPGPAIWMCIEFKDHTLVHDGFGDALSTISKLNSRPALELFASPALRQALDGEYAEGYLHLSLDAERRLDVSRGKPETKAQVSAKGFVQKFLDWYVPMATASEREELPACIRAINQKKAIFDRTLVEALQRDWEAQDASPDFIVGLEGDPFLDAQDPCNRYVATRVVKKDQSFMVDIDGAGDCAERGSEHFVAEVVQRNGRWIFVNFHYPRVQTDVRSMLKRLAETRAKDTKQLGR